jgi:hypothetical protein
MTFGDTNPAGIARIGRTASPLVSWSQEQLLRLEFEFRGVQRNFAYHPFIRLVSIQDDPPGEYEIEYRVRTLCVGESGELEYTDSVPARVELPSGFPYVPPVVRPHKGLFHPNVSWEGIHLSAAWQPTDTLVEYLRKVGELLAWRAYDPGSVVNDVALEWLEANSGELPLDAQADFSPEAGGDPLERICRHGPGTLDQIHSQLRGLRQALLNPDSAPGLPEIRDFSRHTRQTLNLFLADDIPDNMRSLAGRLEEWAHELPASTPMWECLRIQRALVGNLQVTLQQLGQMREPIRKQLKALEGLAPASPPVDLKSALAAIPQRKAMEVVWLKLPALVRQTQELLASLQQQVSETQLSFPFVEVRDESDLGRQLSDEMSECTAGVRGADEAAVKEIAEVEALLETARAESSAIQQLGHWREYLDLITTGHLLERRLAELGAAGVQGYFIETEAGNFGPFQLDEPIDLGSWRLALRSTARDRVRLIDVGTNDVIGKSDAGTLAINLAPRGSEQKQIHTFRLTERWEDLAIRLDFLVRETGQSMVKFAAVASQSHLWCGQVLGILVRAESMQSIREQHRRSSNAWKALLQDLHALGPIKARMETWNFIERMREAVPLVLQKLWDQEATLKTCEKELAAIVSRCGRDLDTGRLIIPPKLGAPYAERTAQRDQARNKIGRLEKLKLQIGTQIAKQLSSRQNIGSFALPHFRLLPLFPDDLATMIGSMTDDTLRANVRELEEQLNMPLAGELAAAAAAHAVEPKAPVASHEPRPAETAAKPGPKHVAQSAIHPVQTDAAQVPQKEPTESEEALQPEPAEGFAAEHDDQGHGDLHDHEAEQAESDHVEM